MNRDCPWFDRKDYDITKIKNYQEDKEIFGHIYKTTFPDGMIYIGQCEKILNSKKEKAYFGSGYYFMKAQKEVGRQNLKKEILRLCYSLEEYNKWEHVYIKSHKSDNPEFGYNALSGSANNDNCFGGMNPMRNEQARSKARESLKRFFETDEGWELRKKLSENAKKPRSEEFKQKIKDNWEKNGHPMEGKNHTEESRKKMSESRKELLQDKTNHPNYNKHLKEKTRNKISESLKEHHKNNVHPMTGKKHSYETVEKIKKTCRTYTGKKNAFFGHHHTEENKRIASKRMSGDNNPIWGKDSKNRTTKYIIYCYDIEKDIWHQFWGPTDASKELGISRIAINESVKVNGKLKKYFKVS